MVNCLQAGTHLNKNTKIDGAFIWDSTPQLRDYWHDLSLEFDMYHG